PGRAPKYCPAPPPPGRERRDQAQARTAEAEPARRRPTGPPGSESREATSDSTGKPPRGGHRPGPAAPDKDVGSLPDVEACSRILRGCIQPWIRSGMHAKCATWDISEKDASLLEEMTRKIAKKTGKIRESTRPYPGKAR